MLDLRDPREIELVGIVDRTHGLDERTILLAQAEADAAVGQAGPVLAERPPEP